jgi:hypothetical protein
MAEVTGTPLFRLASELPAALTVVTANKARLERLQLVLGYFQYMVSVGEITAAAALAFLNDMQVTGTNATTSHLMWSYLAGNNRMIAFFKNEAPFTTANGYASKTATYGGTNAAALLRAERIWKTLDESAVV